LIVFPTVAPGNSVKSSQMLDANSGPKIYLKCVAFSHGEFMVNKRDLGW
jgi:hypothetical protein